MSIDNITPSEWNRLNVEWLGAKPGSVVEVPTEANIKTLGDYIKSKQIGGDHYKGSNIQSWDVFLDWGLDPWACNVIKYVQRHRKKAGKQDLEKAKHYLEFMLENYDKIGDKYYKV